MAYRSFMVRNKAAVEAVAGRCDFLEDGFGTGRSQPGLTEDSISVF
jgi:hypothetical protein